jgi:hypothetical protein
MIHYFLAVLVSGFIFSLTDWVFGGILFHAKYSAHPEIWRLAPGKSEAGSVIGSVALGFLTAAAFMAACVVFAIHGYRADFELAGLCWLMIPIPLLVTNALWIKMHPLVVVSHALGWLAKLCVGALAAGWFLR